MPGEQQATAGTYFFTLNLGGAEAAGYFKECTGLSSEHVVVDHTTSDAQGKALVQKFPGQMKWANITLKRGIDNGNQLWTWRKQVIDGQITEARKDGQIDIIDWTGTPVVTYKFVAAWPCKYSAPGVNAAGNEILVEEIEIAHEGFERI
jgi:phage tail-like protein